MDTLDKIEKTAITIATTKGHTEIEAWRLGALALHHRDIGDGYTITHLPSGLSLARGYCVFADKIDALRAMADLIHVADWDTVRAEDARGLSFAVSEIGQSHNGERPSNPGSSLKPPPDAPVLNGFSGRKW